MAAMMYDSLHHKILTLRDDVEVYPAHGAGSMCGKNISTDTSSTIGQQRKFNYALQPMSKEEFVRMMTTDLPEAPAYFPQDAEINRGGAAPLDGLPPLRSLTPAEVAECAKHGCIVLDVRTAEEFGAGHVPGSMNIGLSGQFASWAGTLIPMTAPIVLVAESEAKAEEARMRLARVGLENIRGHLAGGMDAWKEVGFEVAIIPQISVAELRGLIDARPDLQVLDVRRPAEYESGHVPRAATSPLAKLRESLPLLAFDPAKTTTVICAGGYRSSAATSILQAAGFSDLLNVAGGTTAWIKAGYEVEMPAKAATSI
jgi:rhodanese-related sulfurtransferase